MYVANGDSIMILKDDKLHHKIDFKARYRNEKSYYVIGGRWHQQFGVDVYMIDTDGNLFSICWTYIEESMPMVPKLIDSQVEDFYVSGKAMAIVYGNNDLNLPGSIIVESKALPADVKWSTILGASNRWIVAGNNKGHAILATLSTKGLFKSSLTIKLTHNGYNPEEYATLYSMRKTVELKDCSMVLAFGIDSCCHLISMRKSGQLILVQSMCDIYD